MNEELRTALAALIEKTLAGIDTAAAFSAEQLPDVIWLLEYAANLVK